MSKTAAAYRTQNVMVTMGDDFAYVKASETFAFAESFKAILEGYAIESMEFIYSTPSMYMEALR